MRKQNAAEQVSPNHPRICFERSMELHAVIMSELHAVLLVHSPPPTMDILINGQISLTSH